MRRNDHRAHGHASWWAFWLHRVSGLLLALFLPLHFLVLGQALSGPAALEGVLRLADAPLVKAAEWGLVTLLVQLLAFRFTDMFLRGLPKRIVDGDVAAAIFLMSVKLALALIVAGAVADPNVQMMRGG